MAYTFRYGFSKALLNLLFVSACFACPKIQAGQEIPTELVSELLPHIKAVEQLFANYRADYEYRGQAGPDALLFFRSLDKIRSFNRGEKFFGRSMSDEEFASTFNKDLLITCSYAEGDYKLSKYDRKKDYKETRIFYDNKFYREVPNSNRWDITPYPITDIPFISQFFVQLPKSIPLQGAPWMNGEVTLSSFLEKARNDGFIKVRNIDDDHFMITAQIPSFYQDEADLSEKLRDSIDIIIEKSKEFRINSLAIYTYDELKLGRIDSSSLGDTQKKVIFFSDYKEVHPGVFLPYSIKCDLFATIDSFAGDLTQDQLGDVRKFAKAMPLSSKLHIFTHALNISKIEFNVVEKNNLSPPNDNETFYFNHTSRSFQDTP
ncbi:MAG: hypothetical protein IAE94_07115 [Chthoniobacterales bacterium]|nr:hypothetical protein [Chthoniobacterales bacterium]